MDDMKKRSKRRVLVSEGISIAYVCVSFGCLGIICRFLGAMAGSEISVLLAFLFIFFFSSRRRHTRSSTVSWARGRRLLHETDPDLACRWP